MRARGAPYLKGNRKLSMAENLVMTSAYYAHTLVRSLEEVVGRVRGFFCSNWQFLARKEIGQPAFYFARILTKN